MKIKWKYYYYYYLRIFFTEFHTLSSMNLTFDDLWQFCRSACIVLWSYKYSSKVQAQFTSSIKQHKQTNKQTNIQIKYCSCAYRSVTNVKLQTQHQYTVYIKTHTHTQNCTITEPKVNQTYCLNYAWKETFLPKCYKESCTVWSLCSESSGSSAEQFAADVPPTEHTEHMWCAQKGEVGNQKEL